MVGDSTSRSRIECESGVVLGWSPEEGGLTCRERGRVARSVPWKRLGVLGARLCTSVRVWEVVADKDRQSEEELGDTLTVFDVAWRRDLEASLSGMNCWEGGGWG